MRKKIISVVCFLLAVFVSHGIAADSTPFFFLQLSDPQFGFMDNNKSISAETEAMNKAVTAINQLKPPFVVITGDFVNNSKSKEQIAAYKSMIAQIDSSVKVYMIPGNHDIGKVSRASIDNYKKNYGETHFSFRYGDCAFIGIDSNIIKEEDKEREEVQFKWLEQELQKTKDARFKFVFTHCSVFLKRMDEPVNYSNFSLPMREKYVRLFQKYGVNAIFAGHLHNNAYGKVGNMEMITIGPVGKVLGTGYQGMNLVKVYPDRFISEFIALNQFPKEVVMSDPATKTTESMSRVRFKSIRNLVMAGYQGWFNTPEDGAGLGWKHFEKEKEFKPGKCTIDLWPDVSEYEKTYETAFKLPDETPAKVFSSYDASTTDLHFKWMKQYGIDGVFMQRFVVSIRNQKGKDNYNKILNNAVLSAEKYDRAICLMYDLSGMEAGEEDILIRDWKELCEKYKLVSRNNNHYVYHHGKPLVAVWGIGFNDRRKYGYEQVKKIIDFLKSEGCSILVGVPTHWRTLTIDAVSDTRLLELVKQADIVHPWLVGRFDNNTYEPYRKSIEEDIKWCKANGKDYMPVLFPGFSWHNMKKDAPQNMIPRLGGRFFWKQVKGAVDAGAESLYLAMFDEIDEGTAFFKCTNTPPVGESSFITYEGEAPDHYLWLAGEAAKYLRGELRSSRMPVR
ncbi:metallophosphoesterase [Bacteroides sp. BFG-638]|uniref:Metallophosphoesterase n=1 Tax=Bacteroides vicugnae TaxID=3037989 RepID=A0ABU5HT51_9BACE|nr:MULTISPECIES: metallophosphoesterase [Bacteroides]MBV3829787.1 metallophosphoesterase [Bacteroides xylanisolvens]MBV3872852.1 metallophosphoesterase [Bacteroides xylanisolvens]MBV3878630.1 metallophosphoesterase [Bacteroides xylanisolvens]MBV3904402.1 metallophosphoesterase [Bacteroides xylanisolvens]MBV3910179.1 metallophosphoesterase [Bacteroides xylanisolvens]